MSENNQNEQKPRKRGLTSLTLGWIAEKLRRAEKIREELEKGTYKVNSEKIAEAIVNKE
jgi:anti-sigma28 factor (negative regulator of flagellin synthesis)